MSGLVRMAIAFAMNVAALTATDAVAPVRSRKEVQQLSAFMQIPCEVLMEHRYDWPRIGVFGGLALLLATLLWLIGGEQPLAPLAAVVLSVLFTKALVVNGESLPPPAAFQAVFSAIHRTLSPRGRCRKTT